MTETLLSVRNIETYYGPIMAIRGVSLDVPRGEIITVLGANGAGKTTILKTISGVMDPQKGTVTFEGDEIQGRDPDWVARHGIAHVPEGREIFPFLTVRENLQMGAFARSDRSAIPDDLEMVVVTSTGQIIAGFARCLFEEDAQGLNVLGGVVAAVARRKLGGGAFAVEMQLAQVAVVDAE